MGKKDKDNQSAASSSVSKMSLDRGRNPKPPRFSLRRFFCRRPSARSMRSMKSSYAEPETRSMGSFHATSSQYQQDRDRESPNNASYISMDETSHQSACSSIQNNHGKKSKDSIECPLCLQYQTKEHFPAIMTCHHRSCRDCLKQYLKIEITESRINIACPECSERFHPNDIQAILESVSLMSKYEEFMLRRVLVLDPDTRWCPAPDCGYAVIATGCASCPKLKCERMGCNTFFCYHCKQQWHPNQTCDNARAQRSHLRSSSVSNSHESNSNSDIKPCPRCGAFIVKMDDGSCNHMTCAVCGAEFCWLCMKEISDLHYLSPSGCTFWGKKPWSRKKKILWQLGTLVGAPVGIALVAGIAVPAMIIGIPVWVGKKLYAKYEHAPRHKRNLIIVGGVTASIIIAPVLAGLAVGIGVPILLAYVYGVVPISLCRSGGCGVTTNSSGVRFEFDDDNDVTVGVSGPYSGVDVQSVEQAPHINNPSIGPSIGEMSLGMTNSLSASGSHMERIGIIHESDRESASHRAMAGTSLTGSLTGSTGFQTRVEVQADVNKMSNKEKRASLSSESANFSLDAKSATISFGDNASTKALAGSICTKDHDDNSAVIPPFEVSSTNSATNNSNTVHHPVDQQPSSSCLLTSTATHTASSNAMPSTNASSQSSGPSSISTVTSQGGAVNVLNGSAGDGTAASKIFSRHGSPTSSRSVSFLCDEVTDHSGSVKKKKFKLQSVSVGDSIHEHTGETMDSHIDRISLHSLNTVTHSTTEPSINLVKTPPHPHVSAVVPVMSEGTMSDTHNDIASPLSVSQVTYLGNDRVVGRLRSTSTDSITSKHSCFSNGNVLPEVENDRLTNLEKGLTKKVSSSLEGEKLVPSIGMTNKSRNASGSSTTFGTGNKSAKRTFFASNEVSACHHRPVNQIDSCPALMGEDHDPIIINKEDQDSIHSKSTSLRTIPDPPPLTRSKVTIDGQKRVEYHQTRSPGSSADSMLNSPTLSETRSSCGSSSDNSTCELLGKKGSSSSPANKSDN